MASSDPTRSKTKRQRFRREFRSRWRTVRGDVRSAFSGGSEFRPQNATPAARQVGDFREWLQTTLDETVVEPEPRTRDVRDGAHYTASTIDAFYTHGLRQADRALREAGYDGFEDDVRDPEATVRRATQLSRRSAPNHHAEVLETRRLDTYHDIEDAARGTVEEATREYRDAAETGVTVATTRAAVTDRVEKVGQYRTDLVAATAAVGTINDAALERYAAVGLDEVGVTVEMEVLIDGEPTQTFRTAGDSRVCPQCASLAGNTYPISEVRGGGAPPIPQHPACRCFWTPTPIET